MEPIKKTKNFFDVKICKKYQKTLKNQQKIFGYNQNQVFLKSEKRDKIKENQEIL